MSGLSSEVKLAPRKFMSGEERQRGNISDDLKVRRELSRAIATGRESARGPDY